MTSEVEISTIPDKSLEKEIEKETTPTQPEEPKEKVFNRIKAPTSTFIFNELG